MVTCFICSTVVIDLRALKIHFQLFHQHHRFEKYQCVEDNCSRSYHLFNSFRRHYCREHSSQGLVTAEDNETYQDVSVESDYLPSQKLASLSDVTIPWDNLPSEEPLNPSQPSRHIVRPDSPHVSLEMALASLVATLYGSANLPRNIVQIIIEKLLSVFSFSLIPLIGDILQNMAHNGEISCNGPVSVTLGKISTVITSSFNPFSSEYRRFQYFQGRQTYIPPKSIVVGERHRSNTVAGRQVLSSVPSTMHFIPLREVLHSFFSLKTVLVDTLQYMADLYKDSNVIRNFIQGRFWQSKKRAHLGKQVIPLFLFFDDYETSNALGSHSGIHKLGAVYVSVPCLPPWRCSVLSHIFLVLLFHSSDRVKFGNNIIFQPVIDELNYLGSTGISFVLPNFDGVVYFELALIVGDNLGIHSITGFVESFSANYPCRICRIRKEDMKIQPYADEVLLRCDTDYEADVLECIPANSGVKERCVWIKVDGFRLFEQVGVDVMHDILEGVGKYVMGLVLSKYINRFKYFSLELLNIRLETFSYGQDSRNKPVQLSMIHIKDCNVRLSASEMLTLIRYFSVLIGDKIPGGDMYWALYLKLREVLEIVMLTSVWEGLHMVMQDSVTQLNEMYLLLSNEALKPKFHHLTHYHNAMINFGPLSFFSSMRYEAKHRLAKTAARASSNRRNVTLSLAVKHQLKLNEIFLRGFLDPTLTWGPKKKQVVHSDLTLIHSSLTLDSNKTLICVSWVAMSSIRYQKGVILVYASDPIGDRNDVTFLMLESVYVYDNSEVLLTGSLLHTTLFDSHYYAYEVEHQEQKIAVWFQDLHFQTPHTLNTVLSPSKKLMVTLRCPI